MKNALPKSANQQTGSQSGVSELELLWIRSNARTTIFMGSVLQNTSYNRQKEQQFNSKRAPICSRFMIIKNKYFQFSHIGS